MHAQKAHAATSKDMCQWLGLTSSYPSSMNWNSFTPMLSVTHIWRKTLNLQPFNDLLHFKSAPWTPHNIGLLHMDIPYGMPSFRTTVLVGNIKPHILSNTIDGVYTVFFYSDYTQQTQNVPEDTFLVALWPS